MKYIITESQDLQLRKINHLKNYIENLLSEYEWFNGDVKIKVSSWGTGSETPLYIISLDTGGRSYYSFDEGEDIEDSIDSMFKLLFPYGKDGRPTAVWSVIFV